ncbi:MAG TPA: hypothetical protein PLL66_06805 [Bacteroidales bacterium]|nr:hypothetical protein [Bacteroidales bacterium]
MEVDKKYQNPNDVNHSIEWGESTWDENCFSIRNRYNLESGKFNKAGSGEIPWNDFKTMIKESIEKNIFTNAELSEILNSISEKIAKI